MPAEAPTASPPAAPPASPPPGAVPGPSPTTTVRVSEMPQSGPTAPPKPGSARERMLSDLRKKAGVTDPTPEPAPQTPAPAKAPAPIPEPGGEPTPPGSPEAEASPEAPAVPMTPEERKRVSPWKLVEQYKTKMATLEKEVADLRTGIVPEAQRAEFVKKMEATEKRNKELEDEIRYVNYSKSKEFQDQYWNPYEQAFHRAITELSEITIEPDGSERRPVNANDILQLVNMPLGQAREAADALFGKFADDVMAHRKEIRGLWDKQAKQLEEAKKMGAERQETQMSQWQEQTKQITTHVTQAWVKANEAAMKDERVGEYFRPVEGDTEGNTRWTNGQKMVSEAFAQNPFDPKLTPEQRAHIVELHAAVHNRAAAFGRLVAWNKQQKARIAELTKELAGYKSSEPTTTGAQRPADNGERPSNARESVFAALHKLAKP